MDPASLLQRLHYTQKSAWLPCSMPRRGMSVVVTFRDDAAKDADGAEHAKDGEVLVCIDG